MTRFMTSGLLALCFAIFIGEGVAMQPAIKMLHMGKSDIKNLLQNGDFEATDGSSIASWSPYRQGYDIAPKAGRNGSNAACCRNMGASEGRGVSQTIQLDQSIPVPLLIRGWSKAKNVSGSRNSGYSVYVDVVFQDGTPLWGQTGRFMVGTHDWEVQEVYIMPRKPIKEVSIYGLFRGHKGEVWFDDFSLSEIGGQGILTLDGVPVKMEMGAKPKAGRSMNELEVSTTDGMTIGYDSGNGNVTSIKLDNKELAQVGVPSGFLVRDVAADSDFYAFENGKCPELNLELEMGLAGKRPSD